MSEAREMFTKVVCADCGQKVDPFTAHACKMLLETPLPKRGDVNYYCRWAFFRGYICTANDDGSIPINSLVVLDLSLLKGVDKIEEQCQRVVSMHNELLRKTILAEEQ